MVDGIADGVTISFSPANGFLKYSHNNFYPEDYCFNRFIFVLTSGSNETL